MPPGATINLEKRIVWLFLKNGIGDLVVHLHFSDSVIWPKLDIWRNESLPKLATSFSLTDWANKSSIW